MHASLDDRHVRVGPVTVFLTHQVVLSLICRCIRLFTRLRTPKREVRHG